MARKAKYDWGKSRSGRYQKFETRLSFKGTFDAASSPYADSKFIDIAQCLSVVNRKLVRQGQVFRVKGMSLWSEDDSPAAYFKVGVLPRTWCMFNAYKKGRSLWNQMNLDAVDDLGQGNLPKYYDFKTYMSTTHVTNASDVMLPVGFDDEAASTGEWVYSKYHDAGGTSNQFTCHVLGGHMTDASTISSDDTIQNASSVGLIQAYSQSRGLAATNRDMSDLNQQTADNLFYGPWGLLNNDGDDQVLDVLTDLTADNDDPPYDAEEYPGGRVNLPTETVVAEGKLIQKAAAGTSGTLRVPAFEAPLGLIRLEIDADADLDELAVLMHMDTEIVGAC